MKLTNTKIRGDINPYYLLKYLPEVSVIEDCSFFSTSLTVQDNKIHLGKYGFTGIGGSLPMKFSEHINGINSSKKFLKFLSFLSSYILQIRFQYMSKLLPSNNGFVGNFLEKLAGLNFNQNISKYLYINKNRNNFNLKHILMQQYKIRVEIKKFSVMFISTKMIKLNSKTQFYQSLGTKIPIVVNEVILYFASYEHLQEIYRQQKEISYIIHQFYNFYKLVFKLLDKNTLINNYILSSKIIY